MKEPNFEEQTPSDLDASAGNSLSENPVKDSDNVYVGDVEKAKEEAEELSLETEEEEAKRLGEDEKGTDPYNTAEAA